VSCCWKTGFVYPFRKTGFVYPFRKTGFVYPFRKTACVAARVVLLTQNWCGVSTQNWCGVSTQNWSHRLFLFFVGYCFVCIHVGVLFCLLYTFLIHPHRTQVTRTLSSRGRRDRSARRRLVRVRACGVCAGVRARLSTSIGGVTPTGQLPTSIALHIGAFAKFSFRCVCAWQVRPHGAPMRIHPVALTSVPPWRVGDIQHRLGEVVPMPVHSTVC
jgi:hypothetical protein